MYHRLGIFYSRDLSSYSSDGWKDEIMVDKVGVHRLWGNLFCWPLPYLTGDMVIFMSTEILVNICLRFLPPLLFLKGGCQCLGIGLPCRPHPTFITHDEPLCRERTHILFWPLMLWHKCWSTELILLLTAFNLLLKSFLIGIWNPCVVLTCFSMSHVTLSWPPASFLQGPRCISPSGWGLWGILLFMADKDLLLSLCLLRAGECWLLLAVFWVSGFRECLTPSVCCHELMFAGRKHKEMKLAFLDIVCC